MSDERRNLPEALRGHIDLEDPPDQALLAWNAASEEERKDCLDGLLMEALLVEGLRGRAAAHRRRPLLTWKAAAAAALLLAAVGIALFPWSAQRRDEAIKASGAFAVASPTGERIAGKQPVRGDRIVAGRDGARLNLGGYCELTLGPDAAIVVRGEPGKEVADLEVGTLISRVHPRKGQFRVLTPSGSLEVVGTEFETTVQFPASNGEVPMKGLKRSAVVTVAVVTGLVAYHFGDLAGVLSAGTTKVFAGDATVAAKRIVAGKATYQSKGDNPAWKEKGRIVGLVRQCPGCKIEALDAEGKEVVKSTEVAAKGTTYELQWLSPGTYCVRVSADGYEPLVVKGLAVKAGNDLRMNIEFEDGGGN